jgi:hypothetical protein
MGMALTEGAAERGVASRLGGLVLTGAAEGFADSATRTVMEDLAAGKVDLTAERMGDAAWHAIKEGAQGALVGGATAGTLGGLVEGGAAAYRGAKALAGKVAEKLPTLSDAAGSAAFKAAVGRTSIASQRLAARVGGDAEIGKTLLKRGVIADTAAGGHTVDDIAERLPAALNEAGEELGATLREVADATTSKAAILGRIEDDVLAPLDKAGTRDIADAVRSKLKASGIIDELSPAEVVRRGPNGPTPVDRDGIALSELHALRRRFDQRPDLKWGSTGPGPVDITTDAMRDVRRTIEDAFEKASDEAAKARGVTDFAERLKQAKREYSHLAVANQVSEQGSFARAANNRIGLNDALAGVAGAASLGPAGALAAVGSKFVRDRSESVIAATLHKLAQRGVAREQALEKTVEATLQSIATPAARAARVATQGAFGAAEMQHMVAQARALSDPNSPEAAQLDAVTMQLAGDSPIFANAIKGQVLKQASMIQQQLGPQVDPADPLKSTPRLVDKVTQARNERFVRAIHSPEEALNRLADGGGSPEDLMVVRTLTPLIHKEYVDRVMKQVIGRGVKLSIQQKQRLQYVMGAPVAREQTPAYVKFYQGLSQPQAEPSGPGAARAPKLPGTDSDEFPADNVFSSRTDQLAGGP